MKEGKAKKIILCAVVLFICLIPAVFMNSIFGYLPILAACIGIFGSALYLRLLKNQLEFAESSSFGDCVRGERLDFSVRIKNRSVLFFPFVKLSLYISDLFGDDDSVTSQVITLAPREERSFPFDVRFDHIGTYTAGLRDVSIRDMLGLFSHEIKNPRKYQVVVTPKIYDLDRLAVSMTTVTESEKLLVPNPMESTDYSGVREYVIGDPIKNIHWKLSARTPGYMTKMYESYSNTGVCIILDFHAPEYDKEVLMHIFDSLVETALSIHSYALRNGLETVIRYFNKKGEKQQFSTYEADNLSAVIADMPRIDTGEKKHDAMQILIEEGNSIYSEGNLAYCTADLTPALCESLVNIRNRKKNPMLFAIVPADLEEDEKKRYLRPLGMLEDAGVPYYVLDSAEDLESD